jgi:hypothetical protein
MAFRLKCCFLYSSHTLTTCSQSFCMSSINGSKNISMSMTACLGLDMRVINRRYFRLLHNHRGRYFHLYMHIITWHVLHLSEKIHSIGAKTKSNIHWIIREVLLMSKIEMFSLPTISKMSDLSIPLSLDMSKQELSFPSIGEHTL